MGLGEVISGLVGGVVKPITNVITAKEKRKQARETGLNEIRKAQVDGDNSLNLTDAQWEALTAEGNKDSWKDEYVTVTMTAWIWLALVGAIMAAYNKPEVLQGVKTFVEFSVANGIELGIMTSSVVMAAIGLKVWRGR